MAPFIASQLESLFARLAEERLLEGLVAMGLWQGEPRQGEPL